MPADCKLEELAAGEHPELNKLQDRRVDEFHPRLDSLLANTRDSRTTAAGHGARLFTEPIGQITATDAGVSLLRCIEELKRAAGSADSERGLRDSFMRLYCMMATTGLDDNAAFAQKWIATIEPLERLQGRQGASP